MNEEKDYVPVPGEPVRFELVCSKCGETTFSSVVIHEIVKEKCERCDYAKDVPFKMMNYKYCPNCGRKLEGSNA